MGQLDQGHGMNGWLVLLFAALAVAVGFAYLAGRVAGLGRGEQDRGDLAEKNTGLLDIVRQLEARVAGQHQRIVAMTAWETVPWPGGRTSPVPVRPEAQPVSALLVAAVEARIPSPRPRPRERRTSTAAFLAAPVPDYRHDDGQADDSVLVVAGQTWWREIEDEIWSARLWLATL